MRVVKYSDPVEFRDAVAPHLRGDTARHNLMLSLLATLTDQPDMYPRYHLWAVEDNGQVVAAALQTEPHNVVLSGPEKDGAIGALVDVLLAERREVPGVIGGLPEADEFDLRYRAATDAVVVQRMEQAIHVLDRVDDLSVPSGASRAAGPADETFVVACIRAFAAEASHGEEVVDDGQVLRRMRHRLAGHGGDGYRLWEDGGPVCLVGFVGAARPVARVGPVYTPPEHRRKGYATALTAHVSRELLAGGARQCLLYTDLANPTSNAIYARIGYRVVCDSAMIRFACADPAGR